MYELELGNVSTIVTEDTGSTDDWRDDIANKERLETLAALEIMDSVAEERYDRIVETARDATGAATSLLSLVDGMRQFFKASNTNHPSIMACRQTPLSHSFCKYVVSAEEPLEVTNAREHPRFCDHPAVHELDVIAYLGYPLTMENGETLGSLCVIDDEPHQWTAADHRIVDNLAAMVVEMFEDRRREIQSKRDRLAQAEMLDERTLEIRSVEALGRMSAGVAHEFKNVLSVVRSTTQVLAAEMEKDHRWHADLDLLLEAADNGLSLSKRLMNAGRAPTPDRQTFDLNEYLFELEPMLATLAGVETRFSLESNHDALPLYASPGQLRQILTNLIMNSAEAIGPDQGRIAVRASVHDQDDDPLFARITVTDDGPGMDAETLSRIFEPYFTNRVHGQGTGLGLSNLYDIVEAHEGHITVESTPGVGTRFAIDLPLHASTS